MPTKSEYREYISSEEWQKRRKLFLVLHSVCNRCNLHRQLAIIAYDQDLNVHHRNYSRVGAELDTDLEALCRRCHELETFGTSKLHEIYGLSNPDFYEMLWNNMGPTMIASLAGAEGNPIRKFIVGSVEAIKHISY